MPIRFFAEQARQRKKARLQRLARLLLVLILCLSGCATDAGRDGTGPDKPAPGHSGSTETSRPAASPSPDLSETPGGSLRIWWPTRQTLNPLLETTLAGRAVYDLVYQGLFRVKADDRLEKVLLDNMLVLDGGMRLLLSIESGRSFHDGQPVTATDVAAVLQFLTAPERQSVWSSGLASVDSVQALSDQVFEIRLKRLDPWLPWALTFPVIPADQVSASGFTVIPGSGPYAIDRYDPAEGLHLTRAAAPKDVAGLQHILVRGYRNQQEAMQALERDELDLVLLDAALLSRYAKRSSLRIDYFSSEELLFISYNTNSRRLLHDAAALCLVKQLVSQVREPGHVFSGWAEASPLGLTAASWMNGLAPAKPGGILAELPASWPENAEDLVIIAPKQDHRRAQLAPVLAQALEQAGLACTVHLLDAVLFAQELQAGRYDLAVLSAYLPDKPEPGFLLRDPAPDAFAALDLIRPAAGGLADADYWLDQWQQLQPADLWRPMDLGNASHAWQHALTEAMARSSWDSLCLLHMGLVYGDRVSGQCRPSRFHPYESIEELWVWSGQSS